jgi:hypothetical protein
MEEEDATSSSSTREETAGSELLRTLRSRDAERRDAELRKLRDLREADALLAEDAGAAVIPEKVAMRMGSRMLPFVGIPLFGSFASFIGFWYMATYKDMEFQPAIVATTSFVFLAIGLMVRACLRELGGRTAILCSVVYFLSCVGPPHLSHVCAILCNLQ